MIWVFIYTLFFSLMYPDPSSCTGYQTKATCLALPGKILATITDCILPDTLKTISTPLSTTHYYARSLGVTTMVTLVYDTFLHILEHTFIPSHTNTLLRLLTLTHYCAFSH